jgi:uncharacterized protein YndB with AHSA1/START domain
MPPHRITVQTTVRAEPARVWACYTQPEHITGWNFADPSWHCPHAEVDLRPGGRYLARMEARDGSAGFDFEATFTEVSPEARLAYDFGDRKAEVVFVARGAAVEVSVTFDPESEHPLELQQQGWQAILDNFRRYAEGGEAPRSSTA